MIQKYNYKKLTWLRMEKPSSDEIAQVLKEFELHPVVAEEMMSNCSKSKVDFYKTYIYLVLSFPFRVKDSTGRIKVELKEIDFILGKDFIITVNYDSIPPLDNFSKAFEVNTIIDKVGIGHHAGFILYYMLKNLYQHIEDDIENIKDSLAYVESKIFEGEEKSMVESISILSRELIDFKQTSRTHKEVLNTFGIAAEKLFGENFGYHIEDMRFDYEKTHDLIVNAKELLNDIRETNDSLLSTKQNETMKTFTVMAFTTFPLSLITGILAIRAGGTPIVDHPYGFFIILILMIAGVIGMFTFFRFKKWI